MADEKPPAWTPSSGDIGQVPIALSRDVNTVNVNPASGQDAHALASQIVRENQPVINRFVAMQRQHIEIGAKDVHRAVLPLQNMDAHYSHVQGLERMHYHISPQAEAPLLPSEAPEAPKVPTSPEAPELELPEIVVRKPEAPEAPEEAILELPRREPEKEELEKPERGSPDFMFVEIPCFLAVEFGDRADDP